MFTLDNTQGFTESDCELLNAALAVLEQAGLDESNAASIINNNWTGKNDTIESLTALSA